MSLNGGISIVSDAFSKFANGLGNSLVYVGKKKFTGNGTVVMIKNVWMIAAIIHVDRDTVIKIGTAANGDNILEEADYTAGTWPLNMQAHFDANTTLYITTSNAGCNISFGYALLPLAMP